MLILPIKKKWFDMILSGEKKEEYREEKYYYVIRFQNIGLLDKDFMVILDKKVKIMFRNGYSKNSPSFFATVSLTCGEGKEEWRAESGKEYFVLSIHNVYKEDTECR